jgi:hypothetical protein
MGPNSVTRIVTAGTPTAACRGAQARTSHGDRVHHATGIAVRVQFGKRRLLNPFS